MCEKYTYDELIAYKRANDAKMFTLGNVLQTYFPGAHVELEHIADTAIRVLMGQRREMGRNMIGWEHPLEQKE